MQSGRDVALRFMVCSEQIPDLPPERTAELYARMGEFYGAIPAGVVLECDYVRADRTGSWSVLAAPDRATLDRVLAPFEGLVLLSVHEVVAAR